MQLSKTLQRYENKSKSQHKEATKKGGDVV